MRCALSMACSSVVGFHQRSSNTTWLATVRLRPNAAAFRLTISVVTYSSSSSSSSSSSMLLKNKCETIDMRGQECCGVPPEVKQHYVVGNRQVET